MNNAAANRFFKSRRQEFVFITGGNVFLIENGKSNIPGKRFLHYRMPPEARLAGRHGIKTIFFSLCSQTRRMVSHELVLPDAFWGTAGRPIAFSSVCWPAVCFCYCFGRSAGWAFLAVWLAGRCFYYRGPSVEIRIVILPWNGNLRGQRFF